MAGKFLPLLLLGGAAVVAGKKKKRRGSKSEPGINEEVESEGKEETSGNGAIDESDLRPEEKPTDEESGFFEELKEKLEHAEDDVFGEPKDPQKDAAEAKEEAEKAFAEMKNKCETFVGAVHIDPVEEDEIPINKIAAEQSILPAMLDVGRSLHAEGVPYDEEAMGPHLVLAGLESIAPECGWEYSDVDMEFRYAGGIPVTSNKMVDVIIGNIKLSELVIGQLRNEDEGGLIG